MKAVCLLGVLVLTLEGCAAAPVATDTPRDYDGFSIVPPQESGWVVSEAPSWVRKQPGRVEGVVGFEKKATSSTHLMLVGVERLYIPPRNFESKEQFLQYIRDTYFTADPHAYEFLQKEALLNSSHGEFCVESRYKYKDYKSERPKGTPYLLHEGHCYVCLHPLAKDRMYEICYSETFAPGEEDEQFRRTGETFINSIRFTNPGTVKSGAKDLTSISADLLYGKNRVFVLQNVPSTFFQIQVELDGKEIAQFTECGEVAAVESSPGYHTIKALYGGIQRLNIMSVFNRPLISFELEEGKSNYFVITKTAAVQLTYFIDIAEVDEQSWKARAGEGAAARACKDYN